MHPAAMKLIRCELIFAFIFCCSAVTGQSVEAAVPPTLREITEKLTLRERLFFEHESWLIEYERTKSSDPVESSVSGGLLPARWILANKHDKWRVELTLTTPSMSDDIVIPAEPLITTVKQNSLLEWRQYADSAAFQRFNLGRNIYGHLDFITNLALDVPKYIALSNDADLLSVRAANPLHTDHCFAPEFMQENMSHYHVSDEPELIDGVSCWLVEWPGRDLLWVAPELNYAVVKHAYHWGAGMPRKREVHNIENREVIPGLWLPSRQIEHRYARVTDEPESLWGKVTSEAEYRLIRIEFDQVSHEMFDVSLPPGTRVMDLVREYSYQVPEQDAFDPFAADVPGPESENDVPVAGKRSRSWLVFLNAGFAAIALIVFMYARIRKR